MARHSARGASQLVNVLSIQSIVAYGHVGNSAAVLPLQRLGHEVWPVPTVTFSNHPAHGGFRGRVLPATEVAELLDGIAERGALARCDAVLSGYLGDPATGPIVLDAVRRVRAANPAAIYCCDPVIGDTGRGVYVRAGLPEYFRDHLVPESEVVLPNAFELTYLAGVAPGGAPRAGAAGVELDAVLAAADILRARGAGLVVVTGLSLTARPAEIAAVAVGGDAAWLAAAPHRPVSAWGAGDVFTALFVGRFLHERDAAAALGHAVAALDAVLVETLAANATELALVRAQDALVAPPTRSQAERVR